MREPLTAAIVLAGGSGERFGRDGGKQLAEVAGRPVLAWALLALDASPLVDLIVVVCPRDRESEYADAAVNPLDLTTPVRFASSGSTRQASAQSGLDALPASVEIVAVHDGARPLLAPQTVTRAVEMLRAEKIDGVVVGNPAFDTLKVVQAGTVIETADRERFWHAQTPQVFTREAIDAAYAKAAAEGWTGTDDSAIVEHAGGVVRMLESPRENIKVTVSEDLAFVRAVLERREEEAV